MRGAALCLLCLPLAACAERQITTEIRLASPEGVGVALPGGQESERRWLLPPGTGPAQERARLLSGRRGLSDAPVVEARRTRAGAITLFCRPCERSWIDVVDDRGRLTYPAPAHTLRVEDTLLLVPLRLIAWRRREGAPSGDLTIERRAWVDLLALVPRRAVIALTEQVHVHRAHAGLAAGILTGTGLAVGAGGALLLARPPPGGRLAGAILIGAGISLLVGATLEVLLPEERAWSREVHL